MDTNVINHAVGENGYIWEGLVGAGDPVCRFLVLALFVVAAAIVTTVVAVVVVTVVITIIAISIPEL